MPRAMYSLHLEFEDGSNPWVRFSMKREEYGAEMKRWKRNYELTIEKVDELKNGDRMIFARAKEREKEERK